MLGSRTKTITAKLGSQTALQLKFSVQMCRGRGLSGSEKCASPGWMRLRMPGTWKDEFQSKVALHPVTFRTEGPNGKRAKA